jgi:type IV pilus modification protein PilV
MTALPLKQQNKDTGFTLIEVLIAITIFAVGILGATSMQIMALHTNAKANRTTEAYALASDKMEELFKEEYANITSSTSDEIIGDDAGEEVSDVYTLSWVVNDDTPDTDMKTITITVEWSYQGDHTATISGVVANQ